MPRADNMPSFDFSTYEVPCKNNAMGVKGCGEAGSVGAPAAVINAMVDALAPLGVDACRHAGDAGEGVAPGTASPRRLKRGEAIRHEGTGRRSVRFSSYRLSFFLPLPRASAPLRGGFFLSWYDDWSNRRRWRR